ncbi:MAG: hypothetical protein QHI48_03745 [Bacteroidota bacterium]|nr:hypothetical protein [Bacteroidota bacterium]
MTVRAFLVSLFLAPGVCLSQQTLIPPARLLLEDRWAIHGASVWREIKLGGDRYTQLAFPLASVVPLSSSLMVRVANTPYLASSDTLGTIVSPSDTHVGLSWYFPDTPFLILADANLATGKKAASRGKQVLTSVTTLRAFGFPVQSLGEGFNIQVGGAWAKEISTLFIIHAGAVYLSRGRFQPVDTLGLYDPGDEATAAVGGEYRPDRRTSLACDIASTFYGSDRLQSVDVLGVPIGSFFVFRKPGVRLTCTGRWTHRAENGVLQDAYASARVRISPDVLTVEDAEIRHGPEVELDYRAEIPLSRSSSWRLDLSIHAAWFSASEYRPFSGIIAKGFSAFIVDPWAGIGWRPRDALEVKAQLGMTRGTAEIGSSRASVNGWVFRLYTAIVMEGGRK